MGGGCFDFKEYQGMGESVRVFSLIGQTCTPPLRVQENLFTDFTFESFTLTKWGVIKVGFESPWDLRCRYNLITIIEWWNCFVKSLKCKKRCFSLCFG